MIERRLLEGPRLSQAARAVERRMVKTASDLKRRYLDTPQLLFALLDDPVVTSVFESINVPKERIIATMDAVWGQMDGIAPNPPTPTPDKRRFWQRQQPSALPVEPVESDPRNSLGLEKAIAHASNNVIRRGGNEVEPIDLLQALVESEPSAVQGMFFEDAPNSFKPYLKIDRKAILAAIKVRQEIPRVFFETTGRVDEPD